MRDPIRPTRDPARSIYDAFQAESAKRAGRSIDEYVTAEREAVLRESISQARRLRLQPPTMGEIIAAEQNAYGSADYGAKWAYGVVDAIRRANGLSGRDLMRAQRRSPVLRQSC